MQVISGNIKYQKTCSKFSVDSIKSGEIPGAKHKVRLGTKLQRCSIQLSQKSCIV